MRKTCVVSFIAAASAAAAMACAHGGAPDWVQGKLPKAYPRQSYMTGVGFGSNLLSAQDRARAEIAKQFNVQVVQTFQTYERYSGTDGTAGSSWANRSDTRDLTKTFVDETIAGIEIAESYTDPKTGQVFALAVLARAPAIKALDGRLTDLDLQISSRFRNLSGQPDLLGKIRLLLQSQELMKERQITEKQLQALAGGRYDPPPVSEGELDSALKTALRSLRCTVDISGPDSQRIRDAIVGSLTAGGIQVSAQSEAPDMAISGKVEEAETDRGNPTGYTFIKFRASIDVAGKGGVSIARTVHEWRDGARNLEDAREKALSALTSQILSDFNAKVYDYLSK